MSVPTTASATAAAQRPRLLDQVREMALARFGRPEPGERYARWARRFFMFHGRRHPAELGLSDIGQFLDHLAKCEKDPLRALEAAREALSFVYKEVLKEEMGELPYPEPPKLLDQLRRAIRLRHYSPRTEKCCVEADKAECLVPGCGEHLFLRRIPSFRMRPEALRPKRTVVLFARATPFSD